MAKKQLLKQWYTLDQAIEKLSKENVGDYSRNDLVHYWLNNFLEFHTTIFYNIEHIEIGNIYIKNEDLQIFHFDPFLFDDEKIGRNFFNEENPIFNNGLLQVIGLNVMKKFNKISLGMDVYETEKERGRESSIELEKTFNFEKRSPIFVEGLIRIDRPQSILDRIKINGNIKIGNVEALYIDDEENEFMMSLEKKTVDFLSLDEIYITHDNIQKIYDLHEEGKINNKLQSKKSLNTQARFIRDLLAINYDLHTAQEIRGALDNPRSKISRQFDEKELIKPSGKTIYNYINQIED